MARPTDPVVGSAGDPSLALPHDFVAAQQRLGGSASAPRLLGASFVQASLAVKALEYEHGLHEVSAWERRVLLPLV